MRTEEEEEEEEEEEGEEDGPNKGRWEEALSLSLSLSRLPCERGKEEVLSKKKVLHNLDKQQPPVFGWSPFHTVKTHL